MNYVIYHKNCIDGFAAAYIAWRNYRNGAQYIAANYGDKPPNIPEGSQVLIVDFSYPRDILIELENKCPDNLIVLDHHKTAQANCEGLSFCKFDMSRCGAELTYYWFNPFGQIPYWLQLVKDQDLWLHEIPETKPFQARMRSLPFDFNIWEKALRDVELLIKEGISILQYQNIEINEAIERNHLSKLNGIEVWAVNVSDKNVISEVGHKISKLNNLTDVVVLYRYTGTVWEYSLRSTTTDVSEIAKQFGGGGHKNAAGFTNKELII